MHHILQPNRWSCLITSFAMVMETSVSELVKELGHDGSELVRPGPEPLCRRGFHPQELIQICAHSRGYAVETLEPRPRFEDNIRVKVPFLMVGIGILLSERHAVAWDGDRILDPSGLVAPCRTYQQYLRFISVSE